MRPIHFFGGTLALLVFSAATTLTQAFAAADTTIANASSTTSAYSQSLTSFNGKR